MKKFILGVSFLLIGVFAFAQVQVSNKAEKFYKYKQENLQFRFKDFPEYDANVSLDEIKANQGYFMQNQMMVFQGNPRSCKLFKLHVKQEKVFLDEIDVIDSAEILLKQHIITFASNKWCGDEYQIKKYKNKIFIFDFQANWNDDWAYDFPFVKVCELNQLMSCKEALSITSENLLNFTGRYIFDSSYIVKNTGNSNLEESLKQKIVSIDYDGGNKSLVTDINSFRYNKFGKKASHYTFSETETPFLWLYAEGGGGSSESIMMFYDDGLALFVKEFKDNSSCAEDDVNGNVEIYEYAAFYKKNPDEKEPEYYHLTTNLRVRDKPDLENGKSLVTLRENSVVKVIKKGEKVKIDGIEDYWLNIRADRGTLDKDGNPIRETLYGWCFGGYLNNRKG